MVNAEILVIALYFYNDSGLKTISCRQNTEYRNVKTDGAEIYTDATVRGRDKEHKTQLSNERHTDCFESSSIMISPSLQTRTGTFT
jgi:hypothetical protein